MDSNADYAVALPVNIMGPLSNSNPLCGRAVTVKNPETGLMVGGVVKDKCMGCADRNLDLTNRLFNAVTGGKGDGRIDRMEWWFD